MTCPTCHGPTMVSETRHTKLGMRRRRICNRSICGYRFTTYEVIAPDQRVDDDARLVVVDGTTIAALQRVAREVDALFPPGVVTAFPTEQVES